MWAFVHLKHTQDLLPQLNSSQPVAISCTSSPGDSTQKHKKRATTQFILYCMATFYQKTEKHTVVLRSHKTETGICVLQHLASVLRVVCFYAMFYYVICFSRTLQANLWGRFLGGVLNLEVLSPYILSLISFSMPMTKSPSWFCFPKHLSPLAAMNWKSKC